LYSPKLNGLALNPGIMSGSEAFFGKDLSATFTTKRARACSATASFMKRAYGGPGGHTGGSGAVEATLIRDGAGSGPGWAGWAAGVQVVASCTIWACKRVISLFCCQMTSFLSMVAAAVSMGMGLTCGFRCV
jgi:hypothetical protein